MTPTESELPIEIQASKGKLFFLLLIALGFVALGLCFIISPDSFNGNRRFSGLPVSLVGWASVLFFGLCLFINLKLMFRRGPLLILDENGFSESFSGRPRRTDWTEVVYLEDLKMSGEKFIAVYLRDPGACLEEAQAGPLRRKVADWGLKQFGTNLHIPMGTLKISQKDLLDLMTRLWLRRLAEESPESGQATE